MEIKKIIYDCLKSNMPKIQAERGKDLEHWRNWSKDQDKKIVVFGASAMCELCIRYLEKLEINVDIICDNDSRRYGKFMTDSGRSIDVVSIDEAMSGRAEKLCIVAAGAQHFTDISAQLGKYQIAAVVMKWHLDFYLETLIMMSDKSTTFMDRICELLEFYDDEESLKILWMHFTMLFEMDNVPESLQQLSMEGLCDRPQYFLQNGKYLEIQGIMVDCGAYVGDTLEDLVYKTKYDHFGRYDCYELFPATYEKLIKTIEKLPCKIQERVRAYNMGVGEKGTIVYATNGSTTPYNSSILCNGNTEVKLVRLDDMYKSEKVTFIKMDIEGSEQAALRGAKAVIERCRPMCAICVYHSFSAFWEVPQLLKKYVPEYRMILRHHTSYWDDTVCYAKIGAWE